MISVIGLVLWILAIAFLPFPFPDNNPRDEKKYVTWLILFPIFGFVSVLFGLAGFIMIAPIAELLHWHWHAVMMQAYMSLF